MFRGVSNPRKGSKILTFLYRPRLVCSSLLDLRSSWEVHAAKFGEQKFSKVPQSPDFVLWSTYISLIQEYAASATWPVDAA